MQNEAYNECADTMHYWMSQAEDKAAIIKRLLREIGDYAETQNVRVDYSIDFLRN